MKLAVMQPYFFPYLGYFQLIQAVDKFMVYAQCQYNDRGWINRNRIGKKNTSDHLLFTVPVKKINNTGLIREVEIQYESNRWQEVLIKQIAVNYRKSPFFDEIFPIVKEIIQTSFKTISELNVHSIRAISELLSISTRIQEANFQYEQLEDWLKEMPPGSTYRDSSEYIAMGTQKKTIRIIEICRQEGYTHYLNATGGQSLYSKEEFQHYGICLQFVQMDELTYPSISKPFIPNLSIIDVLMQNGKERTKELLNCYTLM